MKINMYYIQGLDGESCDEPFTGTPPPTSQIMWELNWLVAHKSFRARQPENQSSQRVRIHS